MISACENCGMRMESFDARCPRCGRDRPGASGRLRFKGLNIRDRVPPGLGRILAICFLGGLGLLVLGILSNNSLLFNISEAAWGVGILLINYYFRKYPRR